MTIGQQIVKIALISIFSSFVDSLSSTERIMSKANAKPISKYVNNQNIYCVLSYGHVSSPSTPYVM